MVESYLARDGQRLAFTMIELIFVIVILGILSAVAIPKLAASRDDAIVVKGKSQVSSIRSGISLLKSKRLLEGNVSTITTLDSATANTEGQNLFYGGTFGNILEYPILSKNGDGNWMKTGTTSYTYTISGVVNQFDYNATSGQFNCTSGSDCTTLTQ